MVKAQLVESFRHTLELAGQGSLAEATARAAASSQVYREDFRSGRLYAMQNTQLGIVQMEPLSAAREMVRYGKTAVLNFANPHFPGGGVKTGSMAREEHFCRATNLYPCLTGEALEADFYRYHREQTDYFFSHRVIYTEGVTVLKNDEPVPQLLPQENWFQLDVITCAPPYLAKRKYTNRAALGETLRSRIRNILETAIDNEVDALILGGFGCGVFQNPPEVVAEAFYRVLLEPRYGKAFRYLLFAIPAQESLEIFRDVFAGKTGNCQAPETVKLPGGNVLSGGDCQRYHQWLGSNPLFGKQFSVLGDSLSTLDGYNPRGYRVFYQGEICQKSGIWDIGDAWWGKVIGFYGGELLVNNAWSGSLVARAPGQQELFPSGSSPRRTGDLHIGTVTPDVILVHLGINDWIAGIDPKEFSAAYQNMLADLRSHYPQGQVWCCTLSKAFMASDPKFSLPDACAGVEMARYNQIIRETAQRDGCRLLDLERFQLLYDSIDGTHPTADGMNTLAVMALRETLDPAGAAFLDCEGGRHENLEQPDGKGGYRYVCKRCGHVLVRLAQKPTPKMPELSSRVPVLQLHQKETGMTLRFQGERIVAGRSRDCDLRLTSGYAARYQATFLWKDGDWFVRDNNSMNGTFLNGKRMAPGLEAKLQANDEVSFAKQEPVIFRPVGK